MNYQLAAIFLQTEGVTEPVGVPAWVPVVIGFILLLVFLWGLFRNSIPQGESTHAHGAHGHDPHAAPGHHVAETGRSTAVAHVESVGPDDLKIIEGIGPKIEGILHEAGIFTLSLIHI